MTYVIDIETGPYNPSLKVQPNAFALEPYRKEFYVDLVGVAGPRGYSKVMSKRANNFKQDLQTEIMFLTDKKVYCHNAIFDISCLIRAQGYDGLQYIRWRDTGLLAKWLQNSQKDERFVYSLANCVEKWIPESPETIEFLSMKGNMENDANYWLNRVISDCKMTLELALELESLLPEEQIKGYIIECNCLLPLARGYMQGISLDETKVDEMSIQYNAEASGLLRELRIPAEVIRSPAKLGNLLFTQWGLVPHSFTKSGSPCTAAGDLKRVALTSGDNRLSNLLKVKSKLTVISKYINGYKKTIDYIGEAVMHPVPRLFNSYTGRMSYTSKMKKKFQVGIAVHQLPRKDKMVKQAMVAPPGYKFLYMDFAAQELRLMAQFSGDPRMLEAFNDGLDLHATMTEDITGVPYADIVKGNADGVAEIVDMRNNGKLTNLSSMYRIGSKALQTKFFDQYDKIITVRDAAHYLNSYKRAFKRIPLFWKEAITSATKKGYSESLGGRRYYINSMDWQGESSAINQPVQGSGADLSEIAIANISKIFPDMIFQLSVHDSLTWLMPDSMDEIKVCKSISGIDYGKFLGVDLKLEFPLDYAVGYNMADMKRVEV